jgi:hypothetical protein
MNFTNQFISSQYIYSHWIFAWFIIYISYLSTIWPLCINYFNPLLSLYLALFTNIITLITLFIENANPIIITKMVSMTLCEKIIPIYILYQNNLMSIYFQNNIPITLGIFFLYLGFLYSQNTNFYHVYESIFHSIRNGENNTPFFLLFHNCFCNNNLFF